MKGLRVACRRQTVEGIVALDEDDGLFSSSHVFPPYSIELRPDEISDGADLVVGLQDEHADMRWGAHQT